MPPTDQLMPKDFIAPGVALLALAFTVGSFWWSNWRRGKLKVDRPRTFAFGRQADRSLLLIPLAITNTGARTILVSALRLRSPVASGGCANGLYTRKRSGPAPTSDGMEFASNLAVSGREVEVVFAEFEFDPAIELPNGSVSVIVSALLGHRSTWIQLGTVHLHVDAKAIAKNDGAYVTYDNSASLPN